MQELPAPLSALEVKSGAARKAITYFDQLNEGRGGLETLVCAFLEPAGPGAAAYRPPDRIGMVGSIPVLQASPVQECRS